MPHPRRIEGYAIVFRGWHLENCLAVLIATTDPTGPRQLRELERALAQLPEDQRQVIFLVGLEGMRYEDAAAILEVPIGTVRSRLSRGRNALRKLMGMEVKAASGALTRNFHPEALDRHTTSYGCLGIRQFITPRPHDHDSVPIKTA